MNLTFDEYDKDIIYDKFLKQDKEKYIIDNYINKHDEGSFDDIMTSEYDFEVMSNISSVARNGLNWYSFSKDSNVLEIGSKLGELTSVLCNKCQNVTGVEFSKARGEAISKRLSNVDNLDLIITSNLSKANIKDNSYDYVVLFGILEYADVLFSNEKHASRVFLEWCKSKLKSNGKILIGLDNSIGVQYISGGKSEFYDDLFETVSNSESKLYTKSELEKLLEKSGLNNYKFYYPMPNYRMPNVIFSDEYDATIKSSKIMYNLMYGKDSKVVIDELGLYKKIISNGDYKNFAPSYIVEISLEGANYCDTKFVSYNNARQKQYRLMLKIENDKAIKTKITKDAKTHIVNFKSNIEHLTSLGFTVLDKVENDTIVSDYFTNEELHYRLMSLLKQNKKEEFYEEISKWYNFIKEKLVQKDNLLKEENGLTYVKKCYIDLVFENTLIGDDYIFYDQEWMLENKPVEFILYRAINNLFIFYHGSSKVTKEDVLDYFNLSSYVEEFNNYEVDFQNSVIDNYMRNVFSIGYTFKRKIENIDELKEQNIKLQEQLKRLKANSEEKEFKKEQVSHDDVKVDIVVPVYNAYDYTKKCIETVVANTDLTKHRLVLINDKSPDERISPMLAEAKANNPRLNIEVIEKEVNTGFVASVNLGMQYSQNDCVLLNSDTEVTKNWLDKLINCAYSREYVASVTPLSNNATLASVPNYMQDNVLPDYITLEEYAEDIENCSFEEFPEIPTGHGYCMYVTRKSINEVGIFDEEHFGRGYGEENDFSYRAIKHGYVHLLCDNTFIYHKGTQSFTEAKQELSNHNMEVLRELHPENTARTDDYVLHYPTGHIQANVEYYLANRYRKNILFLVHDFRDEKKSDIIGGTTLHMYDLIRGMRHLYNFHVLYVERGYAMLKSYFQTSEAVLNLGRVNTYNKINFYNSEYRYSLNKLFDFIHIDIVHIHHMLNHYLDIFDITYERRIPTFATMHDLYMVCPALLMHPMGKYCKNLEGINCKDCLNEKFGIEGDLISKWQKEFYSKLKRVDKVITPSENTKSIALETYPDLNIEVIEHGVDKNFYKDLNDLPHDESTAHNIAFVGGIDEYKGVEKLKGLIDLVNKSKYNIKLHEFGRTSLMELNSNNKRYIYHDAYKRPDLKGLLAKNNIELILLLSNVPETYSFTLTEAVMCEIPVIVLDIGALAERVGKSNCGWIMDLKSNANDVYNKIIEIINNPDEYNSKKENVKQYKKNIRDINDMIEFYHQIYERYNSDYSVKYDKEFARQLLSYGNEINRLEESHEEFDNMIRNTVGDMNRYVAIVNSRRYKLVANNRFLDLFSHKPKQKGKK